MSQSNTKPMYVKPSSVPQCLRHTHPCSALEEAQALAAFLKDAVTGIIEGASEPSKNCDYGMTLCFSLLQDKLAIASGELAFPLIATTDEETWRTLWNPNVGGEHGDE